MFLLQKCSKKTSLKFTISTKKNRLAAVIRMERFRERLAGLREEEERIFLNVGGSLFVTTLKTLNVFPDTLFSVLGSEL